MASIELKGVTKRFGSAVMAVDGLDLTIRSGSFVSLLGPSGCGKTTTLRMIAGLDLPDEGEIRLDGRILYSTASGEYVPTEKRGMGLVFQSYALWPHMTVAGNVSFGLEMQGLDRERRRARVAEVLELLHIGELAARYPAQLSGGQQQRVALARMLAVSPDILLLDEPLSNLDAKLRLEMRAELKRLHKTIGNTIVYVTHDQLEAMTMSTEIAVMHQGRLQQFAPPMTIYREPANLTVAEFVGSPPMNIIRPSGRPGEGLFAQLAELFPAGAGAVRTIGVRPDDLAVVAATGAAASPAAGRRWIRPARVETILPTGSEWIVGLRVEGHGLFARAVEEPACVPGDEVALAAPLERFHLFDADGRRLSLSGAD